MEPNPPVLQVDTGETPSGQIPAFPAIHQPAPVRVSTGSPIDVIDTLSLPTPSGHKSRELHKLESFNKAGYSDASGPTYATRTRKKSLSKIQADHTTWVERLHDKIGNFLSWTGPVLPHDEVEFRRELIFWAEG